MEATKTHLRTRPATRNLAERIVDKTKWTLTQATHEAFVALAEKVGVPTKDATTNNRRQTAEAT